VPDGEAAEIRWSCASAIGGATPARKNESTGTIKMPAHRLVRNMLDPQHNIIVIICINSMTIERMTVARRVSGKKRRKNVV
jgi:hypothetical protein